MKTTIRQGVFETNSSSMHAIAIASPEEMEKWKNGEIYLLGSWGEGSFISKQLKEESDHQWRIPVWSYEEFIKMKESGEEYDMTFDDEFPSPGSIIYNEDYDEYTLHYQS